MDLNLPHGEPAYGPWRPATLAEVAARLAEAAGSRQGRPAVIAIDGRGASGKSTLAARLSAHLGGAPVIGTDDLAWHEPFFGWRPRLVDLLGRVRRGDAVSYRPPQWDARGRTGSIDVPAGAGHVIVEGNGASWAPELVDAVAWVQADFAEAERRGIERDVAQGVNGVRDEATAFWHEWMGHELRHFAADRPWERAHLVVAGTPTIALGAGEYAVCAGPAAS